MGSTVNISFDEDFLARIDRQAEQESRNRSELIREAARMYLERRERWSRLFELGSQLASSQKVAESDVLYEIQAIRKRKRGKNA
jgi:metal-responsive CopG/Arc/MetJ family transcriptional regulator